MNNVIVICFGDLKSPENGYLIRCNMLIKKLKKNNSLTVLQFGSKNNSEILDNVKLVSIGTKHEDPKSSRSFIKRKIGFNPFSEIYFQMESIVKLYKYRRFLSEASEIYIEGCLLAQSLLLSKVYGKKIILDTHCINRDVAVKLIPSRPIIGRARSFIWFLLEYTFMHSADKLIFVSEQDRNISEDYYKISKIPYEIIPNEVQPADAQKYEVKAKGFKKKLLKNYTAIACFLGDFGAIQNEQAANFIVNTLAPETPEILYLLVGRNPQDRTSAKNVKFTGFVDDIDPYIILSDYCIAPLEIGSGTKTKMLDYIKYNKRILATKVAAEGLDVTDNELVTILELSKFSEYIRKEIHV